MDARSPAWTARSVPPVLGVPEALLALAVVAAGAAAAAAAVVGAAAAVVGAAAAAVVGWAAAGADVAAGAEVAGGALTGVAAAPHAARNTSPEPAPRSWSARRRLVVSTWVLEARPTSRLAAEVAVGRASESVCTKSADVGSEADWWVCAALLVRS